MMAEEAFILGTPLTELRLILSSKPQHKAAEPLAIRQWCGALSAAFR